MKTRKLYFFFPFFPLLFLWSCSGPKKDLDPLAAPAWRLVPEAIVSNQRHQFFLYGRHLDSAKINVPLGVQVEKGLLKPDGRVLSLYLTVAPIRLDTLVRDEKKGSREIQVTTPDTSAVFTLKVVDEAQPR